MSTAASSLERTITELLADVRDARPGALDELFQRVYPDLRRLARRVLSSRRRPRHSAAATTLVHNACERLLRHGGLVASNRRHFFRLFCCAMEREWVDQARRDLAAKRGGGKSPGLLCPDMAVEINDAARFLDLREALAELERTDSDAAEVVRLRFFCGATLEESAELRGASLASVRRDWDYAKSWLHERLTRSGKLLR